MTHASQNSFTCPLEREQLSCDFEEEKKPFHIRITSKKIAKKRSNVWTYTRAGSGSTIVASLAELAGPQIWIRHHWKEN